MVAKIYWHRYGTKWRHCHLMYKVNRTLVQCFKLSLTDRDPHLHSPLITVTQPESWQLFTYRQHACYISGGPMATMSWTSASCIGRHITKVIPGLQQAEVPRSTSAIAIYYYYSARKLIAIKSERHIPGGPMAATSWTASCIADISLR